MKQKLVRYFFVGAAAAAVDFSIFFLAVMWLGYSWFPVAIFSFFVATVTNYVLSIRFVFESRIRFQRHTEIGMVFGVSAVGMVANQSLLWLTIEILALNLLMSKVAATGAVFLFNFCCRHYIIFSQRPPDRVRSSDS